MPIQSITGTGAVKQQSTQSASATYGQLTVNDNASITKQISAGKLMSSSRNAFELAPWGTDGSATGEIRFLEGALGGSNVVGFKAPSGIVNDVVWQLPDHAGTSGQSLRTLGTDASGGGKMFWATPKCESPESGASAYFLFPPNDGGAGAAAKIGDTACQIRAFRVNIPQKITLKNVVYRTGTTNAGTQAMIGIYSKDGLKKHVAVNDNGASGANAAHDAVFTTSTIGPGYYLVAWSGACPAVQLFSETVLYPVATAFTTILNLGQTAHIGLAANLATGGVLPTTTGSIVSTGSNIAVPFFKFNG